MNWHELHRGPICVFRHQDTILARSRMLGRNAALIVACLLGQVKSQKLVIG